MLMFCGNTIGGFLGGQLVAQILPIFGWQSIFLAGGMPPLVLIPFLLVFLPESPRFLIAHRPDTPATQAILRKVDVSAQAAATKLVDVAKGNPVQQLFTGGLALTTVLVWIVFFANLLNMYLFSYWMPTVLNLSGLTPEVAVFYASMFSLGGILSCLVLGPAIDRFGAPQVLACSFASGVIFVLAVGLDNLPAPFIGIPIFGAGAAMIGSQLGANAMVAALYPARIRSTGVGWALGIGRFGGIAGPAIGGTLLGFGLPPKQIFLCACVPALIAATCTFMLTHEGRAQSRGGRGRAAAADGVSGLAGEPMKDFAGKTAFITGGAGGIGFAMARAFGQRGMKVAIADVEADTCAKAVETLARRGHQRDRHAPATSPTASNMPRLPSGPSPSSARCTCSATMPAFRAPARSRPSRRPTGTG